ncbi:Neurotactin [Clonorchis sinensis]|uniref:Neurotactin n=2 Tax=Clonorchis sinensis TaxID=79923 RepID=G7Y5Y3_CLOSI|nr:Neurotactin [Clonorchis sinensis]GAA48369.1 neurotactin [Clonorchis sinensis]
MVEDAAVVVRYRPLKPAEAFFLHGRPLVDPHRPRLYLSRRFDFLLLVGILLSFMALLAHVLLVILTLPVTPKSSNYVTSQCANMEGLWNKEKTVLRFWAVPYAVPPVTKREISFPHVMYDISAKYNLTDGGYRWFKTMTVPDTEYCFLSYDDRCNFRFGQWTCVMRRPNKTTACVELASSGNVVGGATENCLTLDIATPVFKGTLLPVIAVITGFRSIKNPTNPFGINEVAYLPTDEVVLRFGAIWVNVHYRLGPFGSFYDFNTLGKTGEKSHYTNFALRDQMAALKWIQYNIGRFGGDANKVVLLAHGSGATGALQLINIQAQLAANEPWFRAAWLASGAVNWYDDSNSKWQQLYPFKLISELIACDHGNTPKVLQNVQPCAAEVRRVLMEWDLNSLASKLGEVYKEDSWSANLWSARKFEEGQVKSWFAVDREFDQGTPNNWSQAIVKKLFYENERRESYLTALVFSSMQSEYEGFPSVANSDGTELRNYLEQLTLPGRENIYDLLVEAENTRQKDPNAWPRKLNPKEYSFNALSALRYTCPQAWLLGTWLFNYSSSDVRTRFYHVYHQESPRYPYTNVPGVTGNKRLPFHGLDMLILTGNYQRQEEQFDAYRLHLWDLFNSFVWDYKLDSTCEVTEDRKEESVTPKLGCQLDTNGPQNMGPSIIPICRNIDWTKQFDNVAMFE